MNKLEYENCDCTNGIIDNHECQECDFIDLNGGSEEDLFLLEDELKYQGYDFINKGLFED